MEEPQIKMDHDKQSDYQEEIFMALEMVAELKAKLEELKEVEIAKVNADASQSKELVIAKRTILEQKYRIMQLEQKHQNKKHNQDFIKDGYKDLKLDQSMNEATHPFVEGGNKKKDDRNKSLTKRTIEWKIMAGFGTIILIMIAALVIIILQNQEMKNLENSNKMAKRFLIRDINFKDQFGNTKLHHASKYGKIEEVKFLVGLGSNITSTNNNQKTPLYLAEENGRSEVIKFLLKNGARNE